MLDPYYLLGVELSSTPEEIRAAYRRRAAEVHPDIQPPEKREWSSERMKQLNAARDLLLDPGRRAKYDEQMRLEMQKAQWRAKREAYTPPVDFYAPPPPRRRRRSWFITLLGAGWLTLICLCLLPLLFSLTQSSSSVEGQRLFVALSATIGRMLTVLGFIFGPLIITLLLATLYRYWKN